MNKTKTKTNKQKQKQQQQQKQNKKKTLHLKLHVRGVYHVPSSGHFKGKIIHILRISII